MIQLLTAIRDKCRGYTDEDVRILRRALGNIASSGETIWLSPEQVKAQERGKSPFKIKVRTVQRGYALVSVIPHGL